MMTTKICRMSVPKGKRIIAISDIHAHLQLLVALLDKIGFGDEDELFIIGDFLAKGPENLSALRYLMALDAQENVHVMMGNLEYWHLSLIGDDTPEGHQRLRRQMEDHLARFGHGLFTDMLAEADIPFDAQLDIGRAAKTMRERFSLELDFLRALPVIIETDHLIFVHGGIPHEHLAALAQEDPHQYMQRASFMTQGLSFTKHVIVGHWPTRNYGAYHPVPCHNPIVDARQRIISIDGACGIERSGQVNAFLIEDEAAMTYRWTYCDGFPIQIAADAQAESASYVNITYGDHAVVILERTADRCYIEHIATGGRLWAPNDTVWQEGAQSYCIHSDYRLSVAKGEPLSVVEETAEGFLVKRDGVYGLYTGTFR